MSLPTTRSVPRRRIGALFSLLLLAASPVLAQVVSTNFDTGATQGWSPRGPVTLTAASEVARSGGFSLKTTGRTAGWNGPALDLRTRLARGASYQVSGWVRLVAGQPASSLKFTLERAPVGGSNTYSQVTAAQNTTDGAWVQLQGTLTLPAEENQNCTLYLESSDPTSAYYLDDFTIVALTTPKCPEPFDQSGFYTDFESGGTQAWSPRGAAVLTNSTAAAYAGTRSLSVTGRAASWQGPGINVLCKLHKGSKYLISAWVRLQPGQPASQFRLSLQAGLAGATTFHTVVGNTDVTDAAWVNLSTEYTFGLDVDQLTMYIETAAGTASFYVDDVLVSHLPPRPIQHDIPSLKDVLAPYFPIGAALEPQNLIGQQAELLLKHFDQFTAGNSMKWDALQPTEGTFNFTRADALANFARTHGLRMRGHTLLWHSQNPAWLFRDAAGNALQPGNPDHRALMLARLENHIRTVVQRYGDIVDSWDVVNEVIEASQPGGLRNSPWLQIVGPDYIDHAFRLARQYAGDAALYINDYSTTDAPKRAALQAVVQGLLDRGVPVDGVGHQMHNNVQWPPLADIRATLQLFAGMGLMNEITEMDISAYTNSTDTAPVSEQVLVQQGYRYRDTFNVYRELSPYINSVTLWGLGDDSSWLKTFPIRRDDKPLLFDEQLQAKHAYWGVVDPTQLPIVPKSLPVAQVERWSVAQPATFWEALAPQRLGTVTADGVSWATVRTGWNGDALYVHVNVTDATAGGNDGVDLYLGGTRFTFAGFGRHRVNGADALLRPRQGGYELRATLPAGQALAVGGTLKFDVRVTDGATGERLSWSDTKHAQDVSTANRGTLTLLGERQLIRTLAGTPTIDGEVDAAWAKTDAFETRTFVLGSGGATANVRTLWDDTHVYVLAEVTDPVLSKASANVWEQDSIEIFVDGNNGQTQTYQGDDAQYRVNFDNEQSYGGAASASRFTTAARRTATGYVIEAAILVPELATLASPERDGTFIGFDLQVNDDGAGDGVRSSVATWNDRSGNNYLNPSNFGVLQLVRTGR